MARTITFEEEVYTFHIDFNRHVSNIVYIQWMEVGRLRLLREAGLAVEETDEEGFVPVLVETHIRYRKPLFLGERVTVSCHLSELTDLVAWMAFRFARADGSLVAEGRQKGVFVNTKTLRPMRLGERERGLLEPFLHDAAPS